MIDEEDSAEVGDETNASEDVQVPVVKATRPQEGWCSFVLNWVLGV